MSDFDDFLRWESATRDTIDFKKAYVDMAGGDLVAGLLLSQIVYWHLPSKAGDSRLRVWRDSYQWIAKGRADWWDEVRITPKQFDRACQVLVDLGLVVKDNFRFSGLKMLHLRLDHARFMELWRAVLAAPVPNPYKAEAEPTTGEDGEGGKSVFPKGENRTSPKVKTDIPERGTPLTETTAKTTTDNKGLVVVDLSEEQKAALAELQALGFQPESAARKYAQDHDPAQVVGWVQYAQAQGLGPGWVRKALDAGEPAPMIEEAQAEATPAELAQPLPTEAERLGVNPELLARWRQVLANLSGQMDPATFNAWLKGSIPLSWTNGEAVIGVRSAWAADWLTNRLTATIERTAAQVTGGPVAVTFEAVREG